MRALLALILVFNISFSSEASLVNKTGRILGSSFSLRKRTGVYLAGLGVFMLCDEGIRDISRSNDLESFFSDVTRLGQGELLLGFTGVGYAAGYLLDDKKLLTTSRLCLESGIITGFLTVAIKAGLGRYRPYADRGATEFSPFRSIDASFPSGHTSMAFSMAAVLADRYDSPVPEISYILAALVGISRVYLNRHWSSDVWTGALLGIGVSRAVIMLDSSDVIEYHAGRIIVRF